LAHAVWTEQEVVVGRLDGKVALITGGARGMGKSHARLFVQEGAKVVIGDVLDDKGQFVADKMGADVCRYVHHDVTSAADWANAVATAVDAFEKLDVLVNNAGILRHSTIAEMTEEQFRRILDVNVVGTWLGIKSVIEPMTAAGGGSIVNVSSVEGMTGASGMSAYSASKFAVRGMTKTAAQELGHKGIRVNSVHPGGVLTNLMIDAAEAFGNAEGMANFVKNMPIPRLAEPIEVSRLVLFLASDEASYSTGSEFVADGGMLSGPGY
jgi:3alpha(or 20beta)-hydroxysteroid dehydrogenase